ncbi:MAG: peptide ABC transporter substrate-binding protein [Chloroflexi bacterium]|nr:ABC transporter substrate-binding protein [Chloroflexota bacterium]MQC26650.1 peptide ABC transporter substrate-binding protein [Chloroflexota bacterium]
MTKKLYSLIALLAVASLVLAACAPAAGDAGSAGDAGDAGTSGDAGSAGDAAFEGTSVASESCDYGGKILSIEAVDALTVVFNLCKPDPAFLAKIAFTPFGIQPSEWIAETGGAGELLEHPIGTGPYMVQEWDRGNQIVFTRFDDYWGEAGAAATVTLRWLTEGAARLQELQAGTADFITNLAPDDYATVIGSDDLVFIPQDNPNVLYLAMTNTFAPFDNQLVRQAIAMGIDRQRIVDNFYPEGSEVADYFTPCSIPNGCEGDSWYEFDPEAARALLAEAGYPDGFETSIYYRDVFRAYLPEPPLVAQELQAQLAANLGITAAVVPMESGEFIAASTDGQLDGFYLLGWGADYPHVTNFLDFHFGSGNPQFGDPFAEIYGPLEEASSIADLATAAPLYAEANNAIRDLVPMVPIAHGGVAHAALATLDGAYYPPFGANEFYRMSPTTDDPDYVDMVYVQNAEPISLYCADETDGESLRPCQQVVETLLDYATDSGDTVPELATSCTSNEDSTVWTCSLRSGVLFHDGSAFDANDVVASFAAGLDASSPYHVGNTGGFDYFSYLWDGLMNVPAE